MNTSFKKIRDFVLLQHELEALKSDFSSQEQYHEVVAMLFDDLGLCHMLLPEFVNRSKKSQSAFSLSQFFRIIFPKPGFCLANANGV